MKGATKHYIITNIRKSTLSRVVGFGNLPFVRILIKYPPKNLNRYGMKFKLCFVKQHCSNFNFHAKNKDLEKDKMCISRLF